MTSGGRILLIDDSEVILERVGAVLLADGYDVVTTQQTVGAGRHLRGCDLVIVDFHMPGFDGAEVLESLKSAVRKDDRRPLFYLYTTDAQVTGTYSRLGFDGCFTHKGNEASLLPQVAAAFRISRMRALAAKRATS